jgi:extracellular elastinolytic metalloproteinase
MMALLSLLCVTLLFTSSFGLLPSVHRTTVQPFSPVIPRAYITNINSGTVSTLPLWSDIVSEDKLETALGFVKKIVGNGVQYVVKSEYTTSHNGVHHAFLRQTMEGLEIFNADLNINTWNKEALSAGHSFYFSKQTNTLGSKTAIDALVAFGKYLKKEVTHEMLTAAPTATKFRHLITGFPNVKEVTATLGWLILEDGTLESVWDLEVDLYDNWFNVHVSAVDLRVVSLFDWVDDLNTYHAYPIGVNDPHDGAREVIRTPSKSNASPRGWHDLGNGTIYFDTQGNNAYAQENLSGGTAWVNNGRPNGTSSHDFVFPIDFNLQPRDYLNASTSNLFFWNNLIHDIFYQYGFDEVSGNFQENNFGKGGLGGDAVQANCQDGSGVNNANFATPRDGLRPRMRMYIWNGVTPNRDGDLDQGIIIHEYAHGISNRLTGGPDNVNCLGSGEAGGMGEGWGDFFATILRQRGTYDREMSFAMGPYSANKPGLGIRKYPYTTDMATNPETYGYVNNVGYEGVHAKGEVWCGILLETYWNFVDQYGFVEDWYLGDGGNNKILRDVVDGLKLQPCVPNFVQARDAILQADVVNYKGENTCLLWRGFAKRGLGLKAVGTTSGVTRVTEDFSYPPACA